MTDDRTASRAASIQKGAEKPYVARARKALPLLVVQAQSEDPTTYGTLARALGMPNARNLNYVLGSIGSSLEELSAARGESIPPLQSIVVNRSTQLPGHGFDFSGQAPIALRRSTADERRLLVDRLWKAVFSYKGWDSVVRDLKLTPANSTPLPLPLARRLTSGESRAHKNFKEFVCAHPELFGLSPHAVAETEVVLPSGDRLDVLFRDRNAWIAIEVKSWISDNLDLRRGLYQCIKYAAVLKAWLAHDERSARSRALLASEAQLPENIISSARRLGVECIENLRAPAA